MTNAHLSSSNDLEMNTLYCRVVASLLLFSALGKMIGLFGTAGILLQYDPILHIQNRYVMQSLASLEAALALYLITGATTPIKLVLVFSLGFNFLLYHLGLWWLGVGAPCTCLGNVWAWFKPLEQAEPIIVKTIIAFLLAGSTYFLLQNVTHVNLHRVCSTDDLKK